jgi:hypothetical protein
LISQSLFDNLDNGASGAIKNDLLALSERLKGSDYDDLDDDDFQSLFIYIQKLRTVAFQKNSKFHLDEDDEISIGEIIGGINGLRHDINNNNINDAFYKRQFQLGIKIRNFAAVIKVLLPVVMTNLQMFDFPSK